MLLPLWVVALFFLVVSLCAAYDAYITRHLTIRFFRVTQVAVSFIAAHYYWEAFQANLRLPSTDLRYVWVALCILMIGEIASRQSWGKKNGN